jgi:hypothetical protein
MKVQERILTEEILREIVRRIVAAVQPEKIILSFRLCCAARDGTGQRPRSAGHKTMRTQAKDG